MNFYREVEHSPTVWENVSTLKIDCKYKQQLRGFFLVLRQYYSLLVVLSCLFRLTVILLFKSYNLVGYKVSVNVWIIFFSLLFPLDLK